MIDKAEHEICKRRGHELGLMTKDKWSQCKWCHVWVRETTVHQERDDEPPEDEQNRLSKYNK
jgi:hypothetical protein